MLKNKKIKKGCHQENSFQEKNKGSVNNGFLWNKHVMRCQYSRFIMNVTRSKMPGLVKII